MSDFSSSRASSSEFQQDAVLLLTDTLKLALETKDYETIKQDLTFHAKYLEAGEFDDGIVDDERQHAMLCVLCTAIKCDCSLEIINLLIQFDADVENYRMCENNLLGEDAYRNLEELKRVKSVAVKYCLMIALWKKKEEERKDEEKEEKEEEINKREENVACGISLVFAPFSPEVLYFLVQNVLNYTERQTFDNHLFCFAYGVIRVVVETGFYKLISSACSLEGDDKFYVRDEQSLVDCLAITSRMHNLITEKFPDKFPTRQLTMFEDFFPVTIYPDSSEVTDVHVLQKMVSEKDVQGLVIQWCWNHYLVFGFNIEVCCYYDRTSLLSLTGESFMCMLPFWFFSISCAVKWEEQPVGIVFLFCKRVLRKLLKTISNAVLNPLKDKILDLILLCLQRLLDLVNSGSRIGYSSYDFLNGLDVLVLLTTAGFQYFSNSKALCSKIRQCFPIRFDFNYSDYNCTGLYTEKSTLLHYALNKIGNEDEDVLENTRALLACGFDPNVRDGKGWTALTQYFEDLHSHRIPTGHQFCGLLKLFVNHGYHVCISHNPRVNDIHKQLVNEYDFIPKVPVPMLVCLAAKVVAKNRFEEDGEDENKKQEIPLFLQGLVDSH